MRAIALSLLIFGGCTRGGVELADLAEPIDLASPFPPCTSTTTPIACHATGGAFCNIDPRLWSGNGPQCFTCSAGLDKCELPSGGACVHDCTECIISESPEPTTPAICR